MEVQLVGVKFKNKLPTRCPYCHDGVVQLDDIVACRACSAQHHNDCWFAEESCSACGFGTGLGRLIATPTPSRSRNPEALVTYKNLLADLKELLETSMFRQWWLFFLPHTYIPLFWPFMLIQLTKQKRSAACLLEKIENVARAYAFTPTKREYLTLVEGEAWITTGLCSQRA
jgi:hypothetical protein